jgi:cytochrome P450
MYVCLSFNATYSRTADSNLVVSFQRKVLQPFALPDGSMIPAGNLIAVPQQAVLMDSAIYPAAEHFDPYRHFPEQNH